MISKIRILTILFYIISALIISLWLPINPNYHNWGGDFALYIHQAQGIINSNVKEIASMNSFSLQHSSYDTFSPELYPWGWPILLVPFIALVGLNYFWMKMYVLGFFVGASYLTYRLVEDKTNKVNGLLMAACLLLNTPLWFYSDNVLSEFPFLFFVLMSLYAYGRFKKRRETETIGFKTCIEALLTGFILFFTTIIRSEGYLLIGAIAVHECFELIEDRCVHMNQSRYKLRAIMWLSIGFFVLLYQLILPQGSGAHFGHFKLFHASTIQSNFNFYCIQLSGLFGPYIKPGFTWVVLIVVYIGMVKRWHKDREMVLFLLFLHVLLLIWPHQSTRYLYVQLPLIFYFLMQGLEVIGFSIIIKKHRFSLAKVFVVFLLIGLTVDTMNSLPGHFSGHQFTEGPETPNAKEMFEYVRQETDVNSSIVFFKPRVMSLYTKRKSCLVNDRPEKIRDVGDYLVIHKFMGDYNQLDNLLLSAPEWLKPCFENGSFTIYKIINNK